MARPREFDEAAVTEAAMKVFWKHGYDVTSITMLQDATGLSTGSIYKAFKDKKNLFLVAMRRYEVEQIAPVVALLRDTSIQDPMDRIEALFRLIPDTVRKGDRRGCLLCSAAAGPSFDDEEIAIEVDSLMSQMRDAFGAALSELKGQTDGRHVSHLLLAQYVGMRTLARAHLPAAELDRNVEALLSLIQSPRDGNEPH